MKDKRKKVRTRNPLVQIPTVTWDKTLDLHNDNEPLWKPVSKHHRWLWPAVIALVVLGGMSGIQAFLYAGTVLALFGVGLIYKEMP